MVSTGPERMSLDEFVKRLRELITDNAAGNTQLVTRLSNFVREASQAVSAGRVEDGATLLSRWLDFNLASYSVLSGQTLALLNGLVSAAESKLIPKAPPASEPRVARSPPVELRLSGRPGERAATGFVIENHFDRPLTVTFEPTELIPVTGPPLPALFVSFEPATLVIEQSGQRVVQAAVTITTDFVVGQTYTTTIRLLGFESKNVLLSVTILPPRDTPASSDPSRESQKSAKKRGTRTAK